MDGFVTLRNVKKIYQMGEVQIMAAAGIDFEIQRGEFAVVVGPSGAGKTTGSEYSGRHGHGYGRRSAGRRRRYCKVLAKAADGIPQR